jgi:hypothetical protein
MLVKISLEFFPGQADSRPCVAPTTAGGRHLAEIRARDGA